MLFTLPKASLFQQKNQTNKPSPPFGSPSPRQPATWIIGIQAAIELGVVFLINEGGFQHHLGGLFFFPTWRNTVFSQLKYVYIADTQTAQPCLPLLIKGWKRQLQEQDVSYQETSAAEHHISVCCNRAKLRAAAVTFRAPVCLSLADGIQKRQQKPSHKAFSGKFMERKQEWPQCHCWWSPRSTWDFRAGSLIFHPAPHETQKSSATPRWSCTPQELPPKVQLSGGVNVSHPDFPSRKGSSLTFANNRTPTLKFKQKKLLQCTVFD